jgi:hypothetical protein
MKQNSLSLLIAEKAYTALGQYGMVYSIKRMHENAEDVKALQGDIALCWKDYPTAEAKYLESGKPEKALELHMCLQNWEKAWDMAMSIGSPHIPEVTLEYAAEAEFKSVYTLYPDSS